METYRPYREMWEWSRKWEYKLCDEFGFKPVATAMVDSVQYPTISSAVNKIHHQFVKGTYLDSPVVKFYNHKLPESHFPQNEISGQAFENDMSRFDSVSKKVEVIRQEWHKTKKEGLYVYNPVSKSSHEENEQVEPDASYNLFPPIPASFDDFDIVKSHREYWSHIAGGKNTYYAADLSWSDVFQNEKKEGFSCVARQSTPRRWHFNSKVQNVFMAHQPAKDHSGWDFSNVYLGSKFSTFSWHIEPVDVPSVSVLHAGMPRIWYVVHSEYTAEVQKYVWENISTYSLKPGPFHECIPFFEHRWTHQEPVALMREMQRRLSNRFKVFVAVQTPGVSLFIPKQTLHSGFSTGSNIAEALGVCTEFTAEHLRHSEPPGCPFEETDDTSPSLECSSVFRVASILKQPARHIERNVPKTMAQIASKPKVKRFSHIKGLGK